MKSTLNLPTKLKELRKKNKYSQEYVAEQLNISRQAISHWENGKAYPDIDNLVLLAELYDVSVDELLQDGEEESDINEPVTIAIDSNSKLFEVMILSAILVLSANLPFCAIPVSVVIILWMGKVKRNYKVVYIISTACIVMGIQEIFSLFMHMFYFYGGPSCMLVN